MQKATVAYSIYIFDNSPWTEMNDETTGPPNHPNLSLSKDVENIWKQKHSAVGSTVKTWSLKSWEHLRTNICKYETITFNSDMWISLMRNLATMAINPEIRTFIQKFTIYMFQQVPSINHEWRNSSTSKPSKPSKLVSVTGCRESMKKWHHDMPQHSAILRSPSHTPGLGALGANDVGIQTDARDGRVCLQRLGQGLETETDQGWRLHPGLYGSIRDHWHPEYTWHLTLTSESLWYRT